MSRGKYLAVNTALFALNSIGTKLVSFFLVPIYTVAFTTHEFGTVDLVTTLSTILVPVITLNIGEAVMRFSLDEGSDHIAIASIATLVMGLSVVAGIGIIPVTSTSDQLAGMGGLVYAYCLSQGAFQVASCYLRGREQLIDYALINILNSLISAILNIVLLIYIRVGIPGYFVAFTMSNAICAILAFVRGNFFDCFRHFHIPKSLLYAMIKYSIVLVPNSLMWWIMNSSDRLMVISMVGAAANGIYAVSYKIPTILSALSTVFNQAWSYSAIHEDSSEDRDEFSSQMFDRLFNAELVVTAGLLLVLRPFMFIYVSEAYFGAWVFTVPLLVGFFFMSLGTFMSTSYTVNKDSRGFLFSGAAGAIANVALNLVLIPRFGTMGAAVATCMSYVIVFLYRVLDVRKYITIEVFTVRHVIGATILVAMSILSVLVADVSFPLLLIGCVGIVLLSLNTMKELCDIGFRILRSTRAR